MYPEEKNSSVVRSGERSSQQTGPALPIHSMELWIKDVQPEIQRENEVAFRFVLKEQHDIRTEICTRNSSILSWVFR
jgi:hypothetical protein